MMHAVPATALLDLKIGRCPSGGVVRVGEERCMSALMSAVYERGVRERMYKCLGSASPSAQARGKDRTYTHKVRIDKSRTSST